MFCILGLALSPSFTQPSEGTRECPCFVMRTQSSGRCGDWPRMVLALQPSLGRDWLQLAWDPRQGSGSRRGDLCSHLDRHWTSCLASPGPFPPVLVGTTGQSLPPAQDYRLKRRRAQVQQFQPPLGQTDPPNRWNLLTSSRRGCVWGGSRCQGLGAVAPSRPSRTPHFRGQGPREVRRLPRVTWCGSLSRERGLRVAPQGWECPHFTGLLTSRRQGPPLK